MSILFVLIAVIIYLQSPLSNVKTVNVEGNKYLPKKEIESLVHLNKKTNIWEVNNRSFKRELVEHPLVKEAKIERKLPRTVNITVTEYKIVGFVEVDGTYEAVLPDGNLVATKNEAFHLADGPVIKGFDDKDLLKQMASELNETDEEVFQLISEIIWQPKKNNQSKILLYMNDGFMVDTTVRQFAEKIEEYPAIVAQIEPGKKGIVHMGVGTYFESIK